MATGFLIPISALYQGLSDQGVVGSGFKINTYVGGTVSTPVVTYTDSTITVQNSNPIVLGSNGRFQNVNCWVPAGTLVKLVLTDASNNPIVGGTIDNVSGVNDLSFSPSSVVGQALWPQSAREIAASITPTNYGFIWGDVRRYGAVGDGTTDDTTAVNTALSISQDIFLPGGFVFLCGPLTAPSANQIIRGYGATVRFKTASSSQQLTITGSGVSVRGLIFDGNSVLQNGVVVRNQDISIEDCTFSGSGTTSQACIYATQNLAGNAGPDRLKIINNKILAGATTYYGIYVECTVANYVGVQIIGNNIDMSPNAAGTGIYITGSNSPFTFKLTNWEVRGNIVTGTVNSPTGVGIVTRAWYGVCEHNAVSGFTMGISGDFSDRTAFTGNRILSPAGATAYGLEINGSYNSITGNVIYGGNYSISSSNGNAGIGYNVYAGNIFQEAVIAGMYLNGAASQSVQHCDIIGNSFIFTSTARKGVYLQNDCRYTLISGNKFIGPGSGVANGRGVYIAPAAGVVNYDVSILGNRFEGWERPVTIFNANNIAAQRVQFNGNDCSNDMTSSTGWLSLEGFPPTYGTGITQLMNTRSTLPSADYVDRANNIIDAYGTGTPEAAVTGGVGSTFHRTDGGAGTSLYVKESGTGNVGWVGK